MRVKQSALSDAPIVVETVEMFLARGGTITKCPPRAAGNIPMYVPTISVDGYDLPVTSAVAPEYVPNFVRDLSTYDSAQSDPVTINDDGSDSVMREDARRSVRPTTDWAERDRRDRSREGADTMEEYV